MFTRFEPPRQFLGRENPACEIELSVTAVHAMLVGKPVLHLHSRH
jgi:hypothetical protein